jgi:hypothetical protein
MDQQVLTQLDQIESSAKSLIHEAEDQKQEMLARMDEKTAAFDRESDEAAKQELEELKKQLMEKHDQALMRLQEDTKKSLDLLESQYRSKKDEIAESIVHDILQ